MHLPVTITALALAWIVVIIGTVIQGSIGFGLGSFAVPLLLVIDPVFVPGPVLCLAFILTILIYRKNRAEVQGWEIRWGIVGRIVGTAFGAALLSVIAREYTAPLIAVLVLIAVGFTLAGRRLRVTIPSLVGVAAISGFMGTVASIGGPPLALLYYDQTGGRIRGTLSGIFIVGSVVAVLSLTLVDRFGQAEALVALGMTPAIFIGYFVSRSVSVFLDRGFLKPAVLTVSAAASIFILGRYLFAS